MKCAACGYKGADWLMPIEHRNVFECPRCRTLRGKPPTVEQPAASPEAPLWFILDSLGGELAWFIKAETKGAVIDKLIEKEVASRKVICKDFTILCLDTFTKTGFAQFELK